MPVAGAGPSAEVTAAPPALPSIDPASVHRTRLANGLTVLVRRDASAPVVAIVTFVKAGYFDETDDVVGIAHVLEHMYFKGTARRGVGEIARETKQHGGYLSVDQPNVVASVLKQAEDNDDLILRLYETSKAATRARISLPLLDRTIEAHFGPCEIKTFRIPRDPAQPVLETNLIEW